MQDINKEIIKLFENRYTCKGYNKDKHVSDKDFATIIEAARLSPSSFGYEPWQFVRIKDEKIKEAIYPYTWGGQAALDGASHFVLILARLGSDLDPESDYLDHIHNEVQNYPKDLVEGRKERFREFLDHDFKVSKSERTFFDWTSKQAYIPLTSMLLTAAALNIDSTPIEGFDQDKVHEILVENKVYDDKHFKVAVMVAFGYGNRDHRPKTRQALEDVYKEV